MILQALNGYYRRMAEEGNIAPEGFKTVEIPFLIILNDNGKFVGLQDTRSPSGKKLFARSFLVPEEKGRSGSKAWQTANLLWDHYGYVLAWPKSESNEHKEMAGKQHGAFIANVKNLHEKYPNDAQIAAVYRFLSAGDFIEVFAHPKWAECVKIPGCNLTFAMDGLTRLVCQNESVTAYIQATSGTVADEDEGADGMPDIEAVCLITGELSPVARLHPRTPIPGAKSNAKIVSFQKNMGFDSYGKQQSYNAPTSKKAAFAYTTALNQMLAKGSRQKLFVGDTTTVFWAERKSPLEEIFADVFGEPSKENPDQQNAAIRELFKAPDSGAPPLDEDLTAFFVLGLAPNAARIAVRFWYPGTVGEAARHIKQHFEDCAIVHGPKQPPYLSLFRLLVSTATQGKSENIPPNLAGDFMTAILAGGSYPRTLLASAIRRCRAEQDVTYPRAALIKAFLVRESRLKVNNKSEKEVGMSLDTTNTNPGYLLGRLFAVLEKAQESASPGINATIRDRFYGAASGTPVAVFPHLLKLKVHHIAKLENRGQAVNLEKLIGEIMEKVVADKAFPAHLSLHDQGCFAVGYYHQRQDFFAKKEQ
ncbi:MAG: type I-C CRISPR-associated protein Cas8c/Csd1 [Geobacteraceae bacterium GWF2_54_21]|nr:MAG: type I-C CRISPR-associated protein Cas8c/Csd1 [Geobacteraceae bacterium GWF2_54_21]HBA72577.1 type I-C CRISPR-associated protein Cas8c/Csd1 [Geobacter sp.]